MSAEALGLGWSKKMGGFFGCAALLVFFVAGSGCGGGSSTVAVTITPTTATVKLQATQQFTATVTGNSDTDVTWSVNSVTGGNATVGTVTTQGLYTAPANALNSSSVSVTATSVADTSKYASATVTISSGATVTVFPTAGITLSPGETYQFTDTVTNIIDTSTQATAVYWYVNGVQGGNATTGTITTTGLYTAPSQIGASNTFVVKATLQSDSTSSGQTNATVIPVGAPTLSTVNPSTVAQSSYFEDVYLNGSNFTSTSTARVNGNAVDTTFVSSTVLRARIPATDLDSAVPAFIDVMQQSGVLSGVVRINIVAAAPALISTTPDSTTQGAGSLSITFDGGYYGSETIAQISGSARSATVINSRQLNVAATSVDVSTAGLFSVSALNSGLPQQISAGNFAVAPTDAAVVLTTLGVGTSPNAVAIDTSTGVAVVANTGSNSITLVDLEPTSPTYLQKIGDPIVVGTSPTGVAVDNLRHLALTVSNTSAGSSVTVVDHNTKYVKATITTGLDVFPYAIGVNSLTGKALVVYQNSSTATIIDLDSLAVAATGQIQTTGANPQIAVDQQLNWAFVTPGGNGLVSVVDLNNNGRNVVSLIAVPSSNGAVRSSGTVTITTTGAHGATVGETIVVAGVDDSSFNGTFAVASVPSSTSLTYSQSGSDTTSGNGTVSVASPLLTIGLEQNTRGISISPETKMAVLADPASSAVTLMNMLDQTVSTITLETGAVASAVNPLTNSAVTVNSLGNAASLLNLQTKSRTTQFTIGRKPVAVAIDPTTNLAITVNQTDNTVSIIKLGTIRSFQVTEMSPFNAFTSTTAQSLTVIGNGFQPGAVVRFNGTNLTTSYVNARELTATIPTSYLGGPGRYIVDALNPTSTIPSNVNTFTVMQAIPVGTSPRGIALDRERNLAVVTNSGSKTVSVINTNSLSIAGTLNVGTSPQGVGLSSIAGRAAIANTDDDTVSVIDLDNIAVSTTVSVAPSSGTSKPIGLAVHPGSGRVVVADSNASQVSFFDISSPGTPSTLTMDAGPEAVAIDPTRNIAAVAEGASSTVVIVDLATSQILNRVTGFSLPTGAIYDPDSDTFLVTSSLANNFGSVIAHPDTDTYSVTFNRVGINPTSIDYNYRSSTLVTTNTSSQTLSVMDFLTKTIKAIIPLPVSQQFAVAIDPVTNRAFVVDQNNNRVIVVPLPR
jgi:DNA-binding beta-propeller fold protein YncE